jgi:hypothetical protein
MRRLSSVDLPDPEGPQRTNGRILTLLFCVDILEFIKNICVLFFVSKSLFVINNKDRLGKNQTNE